MIKNLFLLLYLFPLFALAQTNYLQAEEYFRQENFKKAKPIFESYLKQNPDDKKTREYLGDIAAYGKNWDKAISIYQNLVEEEINNANYHFKYGGAMGMKAMSINPLRAIAYIGDIKRELELATKLDPKSLGEYISNYTIKDGVGKDWAYYRLAQIYKNLGKKEIALTWINKALAAKHDFPEARKEKSLILAL